jgi:hypothetical protein
MTGQLVNSFRETNTEHSRKTQNCDLAANAPDHNEQSHHVSSVLSFKRKCL